jgi:hypothetical protein
MIIHTLVYSFPPAMPEQDREQFFREVKSIMLNPGHAQQVEYRPHLALAADDHAPVFVASAVAQISFPDLDALAATSALPAMREFMGRWQKRYPYKVVWVNHEPAL